VKLQVIEEHGNLIECESEIDFDTKLGKYKSMKLHHISSLIERIETSIRNACQGEECGLYLELEDRKLDQDMYQQIVSKIYSVIRYKMY